MKDAKWENWLILFTGIWIFSIPWVIGFGLQSTEINVVMWNFIMIGSCVAMTSIVALRQLREWAEWLSLFMGVWLIFSPLFLLYYNTPILLWNSIIFGVIIAGLSALSIPIAEKKLIYNHMVRKDKTIRSS